MLSENVYHITIHNKLWTHLKTKCDWSTKKWSEKLPNFCQQILDQPEKNGIFRMIHLLLNEEMYLV